MKLKGTWRCLKLRELGNGHGCNAHINKNGKLLKKGRHLRLSAHAHTVAYMPEVRNLKFWILESCVY